MATARYAPAQLSFPGLDPRPTDRLFFALMPDASAANSALETAEGMRARFGLKAAPLRHDRLHVSVHGLGDYIGLPEGLVPCAKDAASKVRAAPFVLAFDHAMYFSGSRALVLACDEAPPAFLAFQKALGDALVGCLGGPFRRSTKPHMTLLYGGPRIQPEAVARVEWTAREFVLVHSLLGQKKHIHLARWPLVGEA